MKISATFGLALILSGPLPAATNFYFSTGTPDGLIATASRAGSAKQLGTETADDFVVSDATVLKHATFAGLIPTSDYLIDSVRLEIYRVFPLDSTNPASGQSPSRINSPSDGAFAERDSSMGNLTFVTSMLAPTFAAGNSVLSGIHPVPNFRTGGEGPVSGQEVSFEVSLTGLLLPAGHYFFVPQVQGTSGPDPLDFYWLSAPKPITSGTAFDPDLQSWIRNESVSSDWLRVGTDIVGNTAYNASFTLSGETPLSPVPEPATYGLFGVATLGLAGFVRKFRATKKLDAV